jgi:hypothetical protein
MLNMTKCCYLPSTLAQLSDNSLYFLQDSGILGISSCIFIDIPASFLRFPNRSFVFNDIQASFLQKGNFSRTRCPAPESDSRHKKPASKSFSPTARAFHGRGGPKRSGDPGPRGRSPPQPYATMLAQIVGLVKRLLRWGAWGFGQQPVARFV